MHEVLITTMAVAPLTILYISRRFFPEITGGGQISGFEIAKAQAKLGNKVHVLTWTEKSACEEVVQGIHIMRKTMPKLRWFPRFSNMDYMYWNMSREASKMCEILCPDVVHLLNFESIPFTAMRLKKMFGVPLVATVNGPIFGCFTQAGIDYLGQTCIHCKTPKRFLDSIAKWGVVKGPLYWLYSLWYMPLLKRSYKCINTFFAVSRAMIPLLQNMGVSEKSVVVVPNPIAPQQKKPVVDLKKKYHLTSQKVVLYAGRLEEDKGVHLTIKALPHLENVVLLIIGKGSYESSLRQLVTNLKLENKVKFLGFMHNAEVLRHYSLADLVVFPNTVYESLSRMLLEACAHGIPIIASNMGGNADIVEHEVTGLLLEKPSPENIAKAMKTILTNDLLYKKMSLHAKRKAKEFSPESTGRKISAEYQKLCVVHETERNF